MVHRRYFTDFLKNRRQLGKLLMRLTLKKYSSQLKAKEVLPRPVVRELCGFVYEEPCKKHRVEYVRSFIRNNRLPMIEFLGNIDLNAEDPYETFARQFNVVIDEWEAAGRSKSGKGPQPLKLTREVRGNAEEEEDERTPESEEREEDEDAGITEERVEDREREPLPNSLTSGVTDRGDEEQRIVGKQGTEGGSEQEGREEMDKELNEQGNESRMEERTEEREDEIVADMINQMDQNDENVEPPKKKKRKRRSPEEIAMEEYSKFCSPRYMNVAMNK